MADIERIIEKLKDLNKPSPSLIPSAAYTPDFSELLLSRPTYTPYTRQEFDPTVPMNERPAGTENWTWSKGIRSHQLWDQEQNEQANDVLQKYNLDLGAWQDTFDIAKTNYAAQQDALALKNKQLEAQNLIPTTTLNDPTPQIRQYGQQWASANAAGDQAGMDAAHLAAVQLARQAGWLLPGDTVASVGLLPQMTSAGSPNANAIAAQQESLVGQAKLRMSIPGYEATADDAAILGIPEGTVLTPVKVSGSGGSYSRNSSSNEAKSEAAANKWAQEQATKDPRLTEDRSNYLSLFNAWKTMYINNML